MVLIFEISFSHFQRGPVQALQFLSFLYMFSFSFTPAANGGNAVVVISAPNQHNAFSEPHH